MEKLAKIQQIEKRVSTIEQRCEKYPFLAKLYIEKVQLLDVRNGVLCIAKLGLDVRMIFYGYRGLALAILFFILSVVFSISFKRK